MVLIFLTWISLCHFLPFSFDLGTVNGVAASCSFLTRILSPILCGITMSWSCAKERAFPFDFHFTFLKLATTVMLSCILICLVPKSLNKQLVIEDGKQSSMQPMIDEQKSDEKRLSLTLLEKNEDTSYSIEKTWKLGQKKNKAWNWYHSLYIQATHNLRGFVYKSSPSGTVYPGGTIGPTGHFYCPLHRRDLDNGVHVNIPRIAISLTFTRSTFTRLSTPIRTLFGALNFARTIKKFL